MKARVFFEEFNSLYFFHGSTQNWVMQDFHFHNEYELILFLNDGATLEVENRSYCAESGDLFLLNNKEYHRTIGAAGKPHNRYVLMFAPEFLQTAEKLFDYDFAMFFEHRRGNFVHKLHLSKDNLNKVTKMLNKIETCISTCDEPSVKVKLKLAILELMVTVNELYEFFTRHQTEAAAAADIDVGREALPVEFKEPILYRERIEQIKKYIIAHVDQKLELDEIAKSFYISRHYLSHYFKKETGFSLVQYITNQKVVAAKALLKKGYTVSEVAVRLSYNSDSHFISVFKRSTGITPKQYAKEKNNHK